MNKKQYFKSVVFAILILWIISYLCFVFVLMEFNAADWSEKQRSFYIFSLVSIVAIGLPISGAIKDVFIKENQE